MKKLIWPFLLALSLLTTAAYAGDLVIVPGQRIGTVTLGMSRAAVHARLHTSSTTHWMPGMVLDTWLSPVPLPKTAAEHGNYLKQDYLTVFFRQGRVVQIEVSSPQFRTADGLCTNSSVHAFEKQYRMREMPLFAATPPVFHTSGPSVIYYYTAGEETSPAPKHFVEYCEALIPDSRKSTTLGLAWKCGAWGALSPEPNENNQEAVIVYPSGNRVRLNPNDGLSYSGTGSAQN